MKDIVIYSGKGFMMAMAAAGLLFLGFSVYGLVYGYEMSNPGVMGQLIQWFTPTIWYIGVPMFGLLFIYTCYRLLNHTPSVIINQDGIVDNASAFSAGLIRWEEIKSMFTYSYFGNQFLGIVPVNIETILARQSPVKRLLFKMNKGMSQAPFAIPDGGLPMPADQLLAKIQLYRNELSQDRAEQVIGADRE